MHTIRFLTLRHRVAAVAASLAVGLAVVVPAHAAIALQPETLCAGVPPAGFADVDPAGVHARDIDCLAGWGITGGTSATTYSPDDLVSRWQMAVFLRRISSWGFEPTDPGFVDTGHLDAEAVEAIGASRALGITAGTSASTFDPDAPVSRWQMALFLTRFLTSEGIVLPAGADRGFEDIGHLPPATRTAIDQLAELGITSGTSSTTFDPDAAVSRAQMASFVIRTFAVAFTVSPTLDECTPPIDPTTSPQPGTVCTGALEFPAETTFVISHAWAYQPPADEPAGDPILGDPGTRIEVLVDGVPQVMDDRHLVLPGIELRVFSTVIRGGLSGEHQIEVRWYDEGVLFVTNLVTARFN